MLRLSDFADLAWTMESIAYNQIRYDTCIVVYIHCTPSFQIIVLLLKLCPKSNFSDLTKFTGKILQHLEQQISFIELSMEYV
jgi:hypothetical protein